MALAEVIRAGPFASISALMQHRLSGRLSTRWTSSALLGPRLANLTILPVDEQLTPRATAGAHAARRTSAALVITSVLVAARSGGALCHAARWWAIRRDPAGTALMSIERVTSSQQPSTPCTSRR
ncbi:protein of unknown function (plasmid) [Cupriavidus taiwanensis]|uniref:Uncharacterized protein n=1 Tax=Cupriavidus taiwanensis TaxID=164546 RepID=A0A375ED95_9BURK|nr:protein of unknown function [Cupriavidus taiwanensis]SOZ72488.1 protein of unknown function [Cupriavidus taiwanensis]SOZ74925.1 protein of unknown function [Cupriavidus taiwanensis]SPA11717.1 protein of unknown function [Cupriavidus taiwanensis]